MQMQIKWIHIYDFTGWMTGPPFASGFIYQEEKLRKPAYIYVSIQTIPSLQALAQQSINSESANICKRIIVNRQEWANIFSLMVFKWTGKFKNMNTNPFKNIMIL